MGQWGVVGVASCAGGVGGAVGVELRCGGAGGGDHTGIFLGGYGVQSAVVHEGALMEMWMVWDSDDVGEVGPTGM